MNHFMARLIFCFFAEDTSIFPELNLFSDTVSQMSASDASNIHEVLSDLFFVCVHRLRRGKKQAYATGP